ncbi:ABC transporter ATP-binding protein [Christensenellaceae bacterium OttesenSCG-928-L17]|nr:ABC transporter ATP-binding protein [Christensenellaceae bacterium OttesenSCG-928-L17]
MSNQEVKDIRQFATKSSAVKMRGVTKVFAQHEGKGDFTAVNNIDLDINDGELVTLLGPSGCGKTTTLRMISGFEYPTVGKIYIGEQNVANVPPNKRDIGMVFQSYALFPHLSIWDNIAYGLKVKKLSRDEVEDRTEKVMELMQLTGMERRFPNQLSGGQQQRVALARAVVCEPRVLLFDEPLSNLDAKLREHMRDELRALQKRLGITSLYVTHDQAEAMAISDRVVIMKDGDLVQVGTPKEIYEYPTTKFVAHFIGKANFIPAVFMGKDGGASVVKIGEHTYKAMNPGAVEIPKGGECSLAFRPESVQLTAEGDGLPGRVTRATYFGSKIEYEVDVAVSKLVVELYNPQQYDSHFAEGDEVKVALDMDCMRLLPEDDISEE